MEKDGNAGKTRSESKLKVRELSYIGIYAAIIAVCAQIAIPLPGGVPITLQAWAITFTGVMLGKRNGTLAVLVYVALGLAGAPIFTRFTGGIGVLAGPTGGFILSFPVLAFFAGLGGNKNGYVRTIGFISVGTVLNFICGMLYLSFIMGVTLNIAFTAAVLPFIPSTIVKIICITLITKRLAAINFNSGAASG
jgi:biotin transport system substrate-specific component